RGREHERHAVVGAEMAAAHQASGLLLRSVRDLHVEHARPRGRPDRHLRGGSDAGGGTPAPGQGDGERRHRERMPFHASDRTIGLVSGWGTPLLLVAFVAGGAATWVAGVFLSKATDALDVRLNL